MPVSLVHRGAPLPGSTAPADRRGPLVRTLLLDLGDPALAADGHLLTVVERAHADRGTAAVARRRTALRVGLRRLAGDVLGIPPRDVPIVAGAHGRPELDVPGVDVSCSRSGDLGLVAVSVGGRIGIDAEEIVPWNDDVLAEGWLSSAERHGLRALDRTARARAVARCWTRKEAALKGLGSGLTASMGELEAGIGEGTAYVTGWLVLDVPVPAGHVASVASLSDASTALRSARAASSTRRSGAHDRS